MTSGKQVCCPVCREETTSPSQDLAENLFTNFAILKLIDALRDAPLPLHISPSEPDKAHQLKKNNTGKTTVPSGVKGYLRDKSCEG